jgi:hypothetical protein
MKLETLLVYLNSFRTRHGADIEVAICFRDKRGVRQFRQLEDVMFSASHHRICLIGHAEPSDDKPESPRFPIHQREKEG